MDDRYRVSLGFQREEEGWQKRDLCPLERSIPLSRKTFFFSQRQKSFPCPPGPSIFSALHILSELDFEL